MTIFSRLVIGFFAIFILAMTVNIYSIMQLSQLENITKSILDVDNQLIDYQQKMSDDLLSMMRYEKKFVIIKDEGLYNNFIQARNNFNKQLNNAVSLTNSVQSGDLINKINDYYHRYQGFFETEVSYLRSGQHYSADEFTLRKDAAVNGIMDGLKELSSYSQKSIYQKVRKLGEAEVNASKVAIAMGLVFLISGIIISIFITVTITRPLSIIKNKTKEIAAGNFGDNLALSSPPEIEELANSFNIMCSKLKKIDKLKSDFFSLMSHELRTPLTTIKEGTNIFLEGLQDVESTKKQRRILTIINEECIRLINLVNSLLDLSKVEAGMMVYNFTRTDISLLISKVTREIEPLAETKKIIVITEIIDKMPPVRLDCDTMLHVLRNLLGNALKFTHDGGQVRISARVNKKTITVSVSDTGSGIETEHLETIFNKYHKANSRDKGTGLGLFIVKHFIDVHGGKVWVEKTSKQGTTFSFALPL